MFKSKKIKLSIFLAMTICSLTACNEKEELDLLDTSLLIPEETTYKESLPEVGEYITTVSSSVSTIYAYDEMIYGTETGYIEEILVSGGSYIYKGDAIASYYTGGSSISLEEKKLSLEKLESAYNSLLDSYTIQMEAEYEILAGLEVDTYEYELQKLNIEKVEVTYEQNIFTSNNTIESMKETIAALEADLELKYIYAHVDGTLYNVANLSQGDKFNTSTVLAQVYSEGEYLVEINNSSGFDWGEEVYILIGSGNSIQTLYGEVIGFGTVLSPELADYPCYVKVDFEKSEVDENFIIPEREIVRAYASKEYMPDVLLLDKDAVETEGTELFVYILEDGIVKKRYITSNYSNTEYYWVTEGLVENQIVVNE